MIIIYLFITLAIFAETKALSVPGYLKIPWNLVSFEEKLGSGAGGRIFRVKLLSREYCQRYSVENGVMALKNFSPDTGLSAFHQELAIMHRLSKCPYNVQFYAYMEETSINELGILMRLYPYNLDYMIHNHKAFNLDISVQRSIFVQITRGLLAIHLALIAHLDLKPANVMIESTYHHRYSAVITDFGVSKCFDTTTINGWVPSKIKGVSIHYADPFTLRLLQLGYVAAMNIDENAAYSRDRFALGVVGWEMLCLERPWSGMAVDRIIDAVLNENKRPEWNKSSNSDEQWKYVCEGLWQKDNNIDLTRVLNALDPEPVSIFPMLNRI